MSMWCAVASVLYCLTTVQLSLALLGGIITMSGCHTLMRIHSRTQYVIFILTSFFVFFLNYMGHVAAFCYKEATHVWVKATYLSSIMWSWWYALVLCDDPSGWTTWSQVSGRPLPWAWLLPAAVLIFVPMPSIRENKLIGRDNSLFESYFSFFCC